MTRFSTLLRVLLIIAMFGLCPWAVSADEIPAAPSVNALTPNPVPIPSQQLSSEPLIILGADNSQHKFVIEVARTPQEKATGLMGRKSLDPNGGMLFIFDPPQDISMWMKDTLIPLDMIFVNEKGRIFRLREGKPNDLTTIASGGKTWAVIELAGGTVRKKNIRIGDRILSPSLIPVKVQ